MEIPASFGVHGPGEMMRPVVPHREDRIDVDPVVALDLDLVAELFDIARDVEDEGIVVVDDEDHGAASASRTGSSAWNMRSAFTSDSSYSSSASERSVMPPPARIDATPSSTTSVRIAMLERSEPS